MDDDQYMERFSMDADFDDGQWIGGEFYHRGRKHRHPDQTRDSALYGVFADSDSDSDRGSSRKRRKSDAAGKQDFSKPVNFVSTGTVMPSREIDDRAEASEVRSGAGLGFAGEGLGFGAGNGGLGFDAGKGEGGDLEEEEELLQTPLGQVIEEGAARRRREKEDAKKKSKSKGNGDNLGRKGAMTTGVGEFEKHTKGLASRMMMKMGWTKGTGLGKNEGGIVAPVEVKLRPKNMGMGFGERSESKFALPVAPPPEVAKPAAPAPVKEKIWLKNRKHKKKKDYITPDELLAEEEDQFVQKVVDMRGPRVRILTNLDNLNAEREDEEDEVSFQPELRYNMQLIVTSAASDVKKFDRDLRKERETTASLLLEKEKLEKQVKRQKSMLDSVEYISQVLDNLKDENDSGNLTLDMVGRVFEELRKGYGEDYKLYGLATIACSYAFPLLLKIFQGWDPLQNPSHGVEMMKLWKNLLRGDNIYDFSDGVASSYTQLSMEVVLPSVRICGTNTWNARDPEPMIRFLELWKKLQLMSPTVLQHILDFVVMPKLVEAVESWDPRRESIPIHQWVHPWLPFLGQKLEVLYQTIPFKLASVLHAWHPRDGSAYAVLSPWKTVFDSSSWDHLVVRHIVPKLMSALHEFQINPAHQELDQFSWVMTWASAIPMQHMVTMLETSFFTKWHQVLYHWLCSNPNFDEVTQWFLGWKGLFPENLLANERIQALLNVGLQMMDQAAEGLEVVQPGARENVSYLRVTEQRQFEATQAKAAAHAKRATGGFVDEENGRVMSLKESIEYFARLHEVVFKPKYNRAHDGFQVYGFGNVSIYVDSFNQQVFAQTDEGWRGVSLDRCWRCIGRPQVVDKLIRCEK